MGKKVLFYGSKQVAYFAFIQLVENAEKLGIELVGLLTVSDGGELTKGYDLVRLANQHGVAVFDNPDDTLALDVDLIISVQYHQILKQKHIDVAKEMAVNYHFAPLPEYRGCNQFTFAIIDDAETFGTTVHKLEAGIDSGPILFESRFSIPKNCSVQVLYDLTMKKSASLFDDTIEKIIKGDYELTHQKSYEGERSFGFHLRKEINDAKKIDLSWDKDKIQRHVRATDMPGFEPPYAEVNGQKMYLSLSWKK